MTATCNVAGQTSGASPFGIKAVCAEGVQQADLYETFAHMFVTIPDKNYILGMARALHDEGYKVDPVSDELENADFDEVLKQISIDRARLVRSYDPEGPKPPQQSLFCAGSPAEVNARLKARYDRMGFQVDASVHEPPDQLGVELLYVAALCRRAAACASVDDMTQAEQLCLEARDFTQMELVPFVGAYSKEMQTHAKTSFFQSFASCLQDMVCNADELSSPE